MRYSIFILIGLLLAGCDKLAERSVMHDDYSLEPDYIKASSTITELNMEDAYMEIEPERTISPVSINENVKAIPYQEPIIIREGYISIETDQLDEQKGRVDSLVKAHEGYYQKEDFYTRPGNSSFQLTLRIPGSSFDEFIEELIHTLDKITTRSINSKDVTEDFIDLETRMNNNKVYLKRYLELLDKADSVKDMISIQDKVRLLQAEIESMQGRLKYMKNRASLSTLNLTLIHHHPVITSAEDDHFLTRLSSSFVAGYNVLMDLLLFAMSVWPVILIVLLVGWCKKKYSIFKFSLVKSRS